MSEQLRNPVLCSTEPLPGPQHGPASATLRSSDRLNVVAGSPSMAAPLQQLEEPHAAGDTRALPLAAPPHTAPADGTLQPLVQLLACTTNAQAYTELS